VSTTGNAILSNDARGTSYDGNAHTLTSEPVSTSRMLAGSVLSYWPGGPFHNIQARRISLLVPKARAESVGVMVKTMLQLARESFI